MEMQELTIAPREGTGKALAKRLRRAGSVPGILYGGAKPETITIDPKAILRIIHGHEGSTQLLTLKSGGNGSTRMAIIREMQFDPVSERLLHVDLQEVSADRPITVTIAIHATGEAAGVREQKGILNLTTHEVQVACLPSQIPEQIDADVSPLMIGDVLTVADLKAPEGVRILNDGGQAVATVSPPREEETAVAPTAPAATAEPEVLRERKPREEAPAADAKKGGKK